MTDKVLEKAAKMTGDTMSTDLRKIAVEVAEMKGSLNAKLDNFLSLNLELKAQVAGNRQETMEQLRFTNRRVDELEDSLLKYKSQLDQYRGALILLSISIPVLVPVVVAIWSRL